MDLSTTYMGFALPHPLLPGSSPLTDDLDMVRRLEDAGAPLFILRSMFEEQLVYDQVALNWAMEHADYSTYEAGTFLPSPADFHWGPETYLEHLREIKAAVNVPVIASLNGRTTGGWVKYAALLQQAGADGLELNVYDLALSTHRSAAEVERDSLEVIQAVRQSVSIPLAVKLSPFYTAPVHFARRLCAAGIRTLVIFNRFYQPDLDLENLQPKSILHCSTPEELLLRLRWAAAMYGQIDGELAITGGVHSGLDAVKCVMVGATAIQMVSALLKFGPEHLAVMRRDMAQWMETHEYASLQQMRGSMSLTHTADPELYERGNYVQVLQLGVAQLTTEFFVGAAHA